MIVYKYQINCAKVSSGLACKLLQFLPMTNTINFSTPAPDINASAFYIDRYSEGQHLKLDSYIL